MAELCLPRSSHVGPPLGTWTFFENWCSLSERESSKFVAVLSRNIDKANPGKIL